MTTFLNAIAVVNPILEGGHVPVVEVLVDKLRRRNLGECVLIVLTGDPLPECHTTAAETCLKNGWAVASFATESPVPEPTGEYNGGGADPFLVSRPVENVLKSIQEAGYNLCAVAAGMDMGISAAEQMAAALNLRYRNDLNTCILRRNKYFQIEALHQKRIPAVKHKFVRSATDVEQWMALDEIQFPVVMKPVNENSSKGVCRCASPADVQRACAEEIGRTLSSNYGQPREGMIVQECLIGRDAPVEQYAVDTVSLGKGRHYVVSIMKYVWSWGEESPSKLTRVQNYLMEPYGDTQNKLVAYLRQVLDAVDLRWGLAHTEIMMTLEGPRLIEVNARHHGGNAVVVQEYGLGARQDQFYVDLLLAEVDGVDLLQKPVTQQLSSQMLWLLKHSPEEYRYDKKKSAAKVYWCKPSVMEGMLDNHLGSFVPGLEEDGEEALAKAQARSRSEATLHFKHIFDPRGDMIGLIDIPLSSGGYLPKVFDVASRPYFLVSGSEENCETLIDTFRRHEYAMLEWALGGS